MYKLIALLLPLFAFACGNSNPVASGAKAETGSLDVSTTTSETAKALATTGTVSAKVFILKNGAPVSETISFDLLRTSTTTLDFARNGIELSYGKYSVTVTGYDGKCGTGNATWTGTTTVTVDKLHVFCVVDLHRVI